MAGNSIKKLSVLSLEEREALAGKKREAGAKPAGTMLAPGDVVFRGSCEGDQVTIREERVVKDEPKRIANVERIERELTLEKQKLLKHIEEARAAIAQAETDLRDHEALVGKNLDVISSSRQKAKELHEQEERLECEKHAAMDQERQLELARVRAHEQAVKAENQRAETKARRIAAEQQLKQAERLLEQHRQAIASTHSIIRAHQLAMESSTVQLQVLDQQKEVRLLGERAKVEEQEVNVIVEVKPEVIPEAHMSSEARTTVKAAGASIHEAKPAHEKLPQPAAVSVMETKTARVSQTTVHRAAVEE